MKTEKKIEHTVLPWKLSYDVTDGYVIHTEKEVVFALKEFPYSNKSDAQFIVKACNSHYILLEALKWILFECGDTPKRLSEAGLRVIKLKAKWAIQKAESEG